jgi:hypothetical protein
MVFAVALRVSTRLVDQADYFFDQKVNPAKHATPITAPKSDLIRNYAGRLQKVRYRL